VQEKNNREMIHQLQRLKWACRRGMLELDVLLGNFLETGYPELNDDDKLLFVNLLQCTDPELFSWLLGAKIPPDPDLKKITDLIRQHAKSRF
jgi:antitoxin CptB